MDLASLLLAVALLVLVAAVVLRPLLEGPGGAPVVRAERSELDALVAQREGILAALLDLDFDHATEKVDDADYEAQRARLIAEGVGILKQLDSLAGSEDEAAGQADLDDRIERAIARVRDNLPEPGGRHCPQCGQQVQPADRFCVHCGEALKSLAEATG